MCVALSVICFTSLTACGKKLSKTGTDYSGTIYNEQNTNGGISVVHDGYLYFINGTKTNDGTSNKKNKRSAIYRVKLNEDGTVDETTYKRVVDSLVGFSNGSLFVFGDFLYYATPNNKVNSHDTKLNYQTIFKRYDLVNKKSYELFTTQQNSSSETISYAYYIVGSELNLVVYEKTASIITSVKIDKTVKQNYVISDVTGCVMSENYGTTVVSGVSADANNFVFYTRNPKTGEYPQAGNYTYKVSPNTDDSTCISNDSKSVSLLSIRNGKLIYSTTSISANENIIYYDNITASKDEKLSFSNILSYKSTENVIFIENADGSISLVCFNDETNEIVVYEADSDNPNDITPVVINSISVSSSSSSGSSSSSSSGSSVSFVGIYHAKEEIKDETTDATAEGSSDNSSEEEPAPKPTEDVTYLIYVESSTVYKIEIMRAGEISKFNDPVKLTKSSVSAPSGCLIPEIVGDRLYIFAKEVTDENKEGDNYYMFSVDLTISDDSKDFATMVGVKEEKK